MIVTGVPALVAVAIRGEVIVEVGASASVEAAAATRPDCRVAGCAPMSASRFTVACCIRTSAAADPRSWSPSSPHAHCTVPGAEDQRAARCAVQRQRVRRGARRVVSSRSPAGTGTSSRWCRDRRIRPGGREPLSRSSSHS